MFPGLYVPAYPVAERLYSFLLRKIKIPSHVIVDLTGYALCTLPIAIMTGRYSNTHTGKVRKRIYSWPAGLLVHRLLMPLCQSGSRYYYWGNSRFIREWGIRRRWGWEGRDGFRTISDQNVRFCHRQTEGDSRGQLNT
jgi:hypothetical protein